MNLTLQRTQKASSLTIECLGAEDHVHDRYTMDVELGPTKTGITGHHLTDRSRATDRGQDIFSEGAPMVAEGPILPCEKV